MKFFANDGINLGFKAEYLFTSADNTTLIETNCGGLLDSGDGVIIFEKSTENSVLFENFSLKKK